MQNNKTQQVNFILNSNNLKLKKVTQGKSSLFSAFSSWLFFTEKFNKEIKKRCKNLLQKLKDKNKLPLKLRMFNSDLLLYHNYLSNPDLVIFEYINYEILTILFEIKIHIYSLDKDNYLNKIIINGNYTKTISLFKEQDNFDLIVNQFDDQKLSICQQLACSIVENLIGKTNKQPLDFIEYQQYQDASFDDQLLRSKPKYKRSFSDCFSNLNTSSEIYKKEYNIFSNLDIPSDFIKKIKDQQIENLSFQNEQQNKKKISYYFSEEMLKETNSQEVALCENLDESKITSQQRVSDMTITKLMEDFEYDELKQNYYNSDFEKQRYSTDGTNVQTNNTNNFIDSINQIQNLHQDNLIIFDDQLKSKNNNFQACQNQDSKKYTGYLKFFDENKNFGFIVKDDDFSDVFVHYDDLQKANLNKMNLKIKKDGSFLRFKFNILNYIGKHSQSRKAIDIIVLNDEKVDNSHFYCTGYEEFY